MKQFSKFFNSQYRTPEWKAKRKWILKRDKKKCVRCGAKHSIMNVHHIRYTAKFIYDEPDCNLQTLCVDCHRFVHLKKSGMVTGKIRKADRERGFDHENDKNIYTGHLSCIFNN